MPMTDDFCFDVDRMKRLHEDDFQRKLLRALEQQVQVRPPLTTITDYNAGWNTSGKTTSANTTIGLGLAVPEMRYWTQPNMPANMPALAPMPSPPRTFRARLEKEVKDWCGGMLDKY